MRADCHVHTRFSKDSEADPEDMIRSAIEKDLKVICFTDHEDKDYVCEGEEYVFEAEEYFRQMRLLRDKYSGQIDIRIGVELGLQPHLGEFYSRYTKAYPFDFVIGSVHVIMSKDPYYTGFFDGISDEQAYEKAWEETLENIKVVQDFDVLGHLDYIVRYGKKKAADYSYVRYADQIDEILRHLIENGKGLELNTAGLKYGLPFAHPHPDVLKRYRQLGGEIVTVGSDAHRREHLAYDFAKVNEILTACGFNYYTEFKERKPIFKKIL